MKNIKYLEEKQLLKNCYVFKHSTRCPISAAAAKNIRQIKWEIPLFWINTIEQRELSNWIEQTYGVKHETPQLLRIENNKATKVWNHNQITEEAINAG